MSEDKHDMEIISAATRTEELAVKTMADFVFISPFLARFHHSGGGGREGWDVSPGRSWGGLGTQADPT